MANEKAQHEQEPSIEANDSGSSEHQREPEKNFNKRDSSQISADQGRREIDAEIALKLRQVVLMESTLAKEFAGTGREQNYNHDQADNALSFF
jgi:hypothetical protein